MTNRGRIIWSGELRVNGWTRILTSIRPRLPLLGCWFVTSLLSYLKKKLTFTLAFVIGSAIPQVQSIIGLIASIAIMQFTYTFPPLLRFGYDVITDAMATDAPFVPGKGASGRADGWNQWSRWKRVSVYWSITAKTESDKSYQGFVRRKMVL